MGRHKRGPMENSAKFVTAVSGATRRWAVLAAAFSGCIRTARGTSGSNWRQGCGDGDPERRNSMRCQETRRSHRAPILREFSKRFLAWAENSNTLKPNTRRYYTYGWRLLSFSVLASMPIDQITAETIDVIKFRRPVIDRKSGEDTGTIIDCSRAYTNQALRKLKVMLGKAREWKVLKERTSFTIPRLPDATSSSTTQPRRHSSANWAKAQAVQRCATGRGS
jgi:hypothetical protein